MEADRCVMQKAGRKSGMKILITGANGYLGQGIVKQLLDDGVYVVAAGHTADMIDKRAEIRCCDLFGVENPYEYFGKPDAVLHLAWHNGFKHSAESHIAELPDHYMFLKKLIEEGIHKVTVMGSVHEIGFYEGSVDENTPANPQSLYGIAKNALRQAVEIKCKECGTEFQWIRGFYIVGNTSHGCSIFSKITEAENENKKEFPFTTGMNQFDFIDYDRFCRQVSAVTEQDDVSGIINCCSGRPERIGDRVERFIKDNNYHIKLQYGAFPERTYDSKAIWGNSKKIESIIEKKKEQGNYNA